MIICGALFPAHEHAGKNAPFLREKTTVMNIGINCEDVILQFQFLSYNQIKRRNA